MTAPLAGIVVVSLEQAIAVPFATRQMADLGATVLKIERPGSGDFARHYDGNVKGQSAFFVWANRGKHSIELDTKADAARLEALIAGADVWLHNLSPEAARRAGLDAASVFERHRSLIACEVSGYGDGGPRAADKAYDLAIQAESGVYDVCGDGEMMAKVGFSIADIAAGMYAFSGVLAALVRRERTGEGAVVQVSMLEALTEWMSAPLINAAATGKPFRRTARRHAFIAPYGTFTLADDSQLLIAIQNDAEWKRLCEVVLRRNELVADPRFSTPAARIEHVDLLEAEIADAFRQAAPSEIRERLRDADLAVASVNTLADVWNHEQLRARGRFWPTELPAGEAFETLKGGVTINDTPPPPNWVPALGEDRRHR